MKILQTMVLAACSSAILSSVAYPPAPHHLFYGTVRDELGNPLAVEDAEVILQAASGSTVKSRLTRGIAPGVNYQLPVPMDAGITRDLYRPTAMRPMVPFRISVRVGQTVYLPIEMAGDLALMGEPSKKTELNLTLGEDLDGDGLPDAWERALMRDGKELSDITPNGDDDGDGLLNLDEYIAGSYAFDPEDGFDLKILPSEAGPVLEFLSVKGRSYSIVGSTDFDGWNEVLFRLERDAAEDPPRSSYEAADSRFVQIRVAPSDESVAYKFFRVMVQ